MKNYIGAKIIQAKLTTLYAYKCQKYGDEAMCKDGDAFIEGYIVVYPPIGNEDKPYLSWSPKEVFEKAYREIDKAEMDLINGRWD
jgi:hypothetical protein